MLEAAIGSLGTLSQSHSSWEAENGILRCTLGEAETVKDPYADCLTLLTHFRKLISYT